MGGWGLVWRERECSIVQDSGPDCNDQLTSNSTTEKKINVTIDLMVLDKKLSDDQKSRGLIEQEVLSMFQNLLWKLYN